MAEISVIYRLWPTHRDCIEYLEHIRWGNAPICPYCGAKRVRRNDGARHSSNSSRWRWKCRDCDRSFSATVGTIFHRTHVDLQRWFLLISLMMDSEGLSLNEAVRHLGMRRSTVWSMMRRIRAAPADGISLKALYMAGKSALPA